MAVRKTPAKAAEKTAAAKTTTVMTEEVKTEKATAKKAPVKRGAAKKEAAAKKAPAAAVAKKEVKENVFVQFMGAEYNLDEIRTNVKNAWIAETSKTENDIEDVQIYIKPEEKAAYYVVNGEFVEGGRKIEL